MQTTNRIIYDMPPEEYHKHPAISKSGLDQFDKSPEHYRYWKDNPKEATPAMTFGTAYHMAVLEPERFDKTYIAIDGNRNSTTVKEAIAEAENAGKVVLKQAELDKVLAMREALFRKETARSLLSGTKEASFFWTDPDYGVECKARIDTFLGVDILVDLKSTESALDIDFTKSIINYNYYVQAAFYCDGYEAVTGRKAKGFVFIPQEKNPPYSCAFYNLIDDDVAFGRKKYKYLLRDYAECLATNEWRGLEDKISSIWLPSYVTGGKN